MIDYDDLQHFGAIVTRAETTPGRNYWRLIEARHADPNTEFGGDHHIYIEALDEHGRPLRLVEAQVEQGSISRLMLDKNRGEPGCNWPLWRDARVNVSMVGTSDQVGPLHAVMGSYQGGDWHHHSWYVVFQRTAADEATPAPPAEDVAELLRRALWVDGNSSTLFAQYARRHNLGAPVTLAFDLDGYSVQGFAGGIVFARAGGGDVEHVAW